MVHQSEDGIAISPQCPSPMREAAYRLLNFSRMSDLPQHPRLRPQRRA